MATTRVRIVRTPKPTVEERPATTRVRVARAAPLRPAAEQKAKAVEAPKPAPREESSGSDRTDYDRIILSYKEKATNRKNAIRSHCVDCMGGLVQEIARCTSTDCSLYAFRMGKNPFDSRTIEAGQKRGED